jgi:hypothetical protein
VWSREQKRGLGMHSACVCASFSTLPPTSLRRSEVLLFRITVACIRSCFRMGCYCVAFVCHFLFCHHWYTVFIAFFFLASLLRLSLFVSFVFLGCCFTPSFLRYVRTFPNECLSAFYSSTFLMLFLLGLLFLFLLAVVISNFLLPSPSPSLECDAVALRFFFF